LSFSYLYAMLSHIHHIAIICSDYEKSKQFYTEILGLKIIREVYRAERKSYKLDLSLNGVYVIELFSFPDSPARISQPEATGLRHLAFAVQNINAILANLKEHGVEAEPLRTDEYTGKRFTFMEDPDRLPIELYEV
jgi:glyoxylase I family protein